ncbi:MAG TPA: phosphoglycerate mutase, partial [Thermoplasmata archaeon]|nr:phosphoglycerate mutase [Thermoplasmata archaeon]
TRIVVTGDHATPCILRAHSDDPVPLLVAGPGIAPDEGTNGPSARKFGEAGCAAGSLGTVRGRDVLGLLMT